jgi:hypothetical protein
MDFLHYSITIIKVLPYRLQCYIIAKCIVTYMSHICLLPANVCNLCHNAQRVYMSHICLLPAGLYMQLQNPQLFIHRSYIYTSLTISKKEGYPLLFNTSLSAHLSTYINCWWFNRIVTCKAGITEACLITYHLTKLVCFKVSK